MADHWFPVLLTEITLITNETVHLSSPGGVSTKAIHSQHTFRGWGTLLWTPMADGHLGPFSMGPLVWRNAWTPHGKGHHLLPEGPRCKKHGINPAFGYFNKSERTSAPPTPHTKEILLTAQVIQEAERNSRLKADKQVTCLTDDWGGKANKYSKFSTCKCLLAVSVWTVSCAWCWLIFFHSRHLCFS